MIGVDFFYKLIVQVIAIALTCILPTIMFALAENLEFSEHISKQLASANCFRPFSGHFSLEKSTKNVYNRRVENLNRVL